jgi:hypothetical protein
LRLIKFHITASYILAGLVAALSAMLLPDAAVAWQPGIRVNAGAWTDNSSPDAEEAALPTSALVSIRGELPAAGARVYAEAWLGSHDFFADNKTLELREAFIAIPIAEGSVRVGRQILPWGRADEINPTDSLVSRDWQWRVTTQDEQRFGNDGIEVVAPIGEYVVQAVWLVSMQSTRLPFISGLQKVPYSDIGRRSNIGLRADRSGKRLDWGASYYQGADVAPSLSATTTTLVPRLAWQNYPIRRLGGDFAASLGRATIRGELAHTEALDRAQPAAGSLPGQRASYVKVVLGGDRDLGAGFNVNVQWVGQYVTGGAAPVSGPPITQFIQKVQALVNQQPVRMLNGLAYRFQQAAINDTLRLELSGLVYSQDQGSLARLRITYQFNDSLTVVLGGDRYFGSADSILGALKPNNTWFAQLQCSI